MTEEEQSHLTDGGRHIGLLRFWLVLMAVVLVQITIAAVVIRLLPDWQTRGQFGDLFGVANALFSGVAFAGLVYTIFLQREELRLQREEIRLTRNELSRTATAQENSEKALQAQVAAAQRSANLASLNFLLQRYENRLAELDRMSGAAAASWRNVEMAKLYDKKGSLEEIIENVYKDVMLQWGAQ